MYIYIYKNHVSLSLYIYISLSAELHSCILASSFQLHTSSHADVSLIMRDSKTMQVLIITGEPW